MDPYPQHLTRFMTERVLAHKEHAPFLNQQLGRLYEKFYIKNPAGPFQLLCHCSGFSQFADITNADGNMLVIKVFY